MTFGEKVRKAREAAGLSQVKLAEKTGISLRTIQNYETAGKLPKKREYYELLADALNLELDVLLDENAEFVLKATEEYGSRGSEQAQRLLEEVTGMFAGGELEEEDKDAFLKAIQEAYWIAKEKNKRHIPHKYRKTED